MTTVHIVGETGLGSPILQFQEPITDSLITCLRGFCGKNQSFYISSDKEMYHNRGTFERNRTNRECQREFLNLMLSRTPV